jgi:asparagine synthase (glutamine-hydrolysing)
MCGIAGVVLPPGERADESALRAMTEALRHRGPDAEGYLVHENVGLGHRRLTVIDTSEAANQPLFNEDGTVGLVFNGEIYNFQQLRQELVARGHRFRTRSDAEVLVHGWEEHGPDLVRRLRGMFAFAIHDRGSDELFLARDRLGKKPLYYSRTGGRFLFASEIKALLEAPEVSRQISPRTVGEYMVYGSSVGENTIFEGIRKLPPAHRMRVNTDRPEDGPEAEAYWAFPPDPEPGIDVEGWLEELDHALREAVRLRLISDVPLGAFLSGGIDSSLVVSYMSELATERVRTFCIGFHEAPWDESDHARAVAEHLGTEHRVEYVTPNAVEILPELVDTYDEPFADPSAIPTYYICQLTRRHVTVALSGDGGDEMFMGYQRYVETDLLSRIGRYLTPPGRALARSASKLFREASFASRALNRISLRGFDLYHHAMGYSEVFLPLLRPDVLSSLGSVAESRAARDFHRPDSADLLQRCRYMDVLSYLPDQILVKVDRAAMRHSLEVRSPLLDHEVAELASRMPAAAQLSRRVQKLLLRRLAYRHLPRRLVDRPKVGFGVPLRRWLRHELAPLVRQMLADAGSPMWDYFVQPTAAQRFADHLSGRAYAEAPLWRLLFFWAWAGKLLR